MQLPHRFCSDLFCSKNKEILDVLVLQPSTVTRAKWKKKFYLYPPLPPLSLISLSARSPLSQPPLMRKQYNFNIEHGRQLGEKRRFFHEVLLKESSEPAPSTSSSTFTSPSSSTSAISSHIAVLQFKRLKRAG